MLSYKQGDKVLCIKISDRIGLYFVKPIIGKIYTVNDPISVNGMNWFSLTGPELETTCSFLKDDFTPATEIAVTLFSDKND